MEGNLEWKEWIYCLDCKLQGTWEKLIKVFLSNMRKNILVTQKHWVALNIKMHIGPLKESDETYVKNIDLIMYSRFLWKNIYSFGNA